MPTVFVPNKAGHDYTAAEDFGNLVFLTEGDVNRFDTNGLYRKCAMAMRDSSPHDFLLISALPIINAIASSVLARQHGVVSYLIFRDGSYVERQVNFDNLLNL